MGTKKLSDISKVAAINADDYIIMNVADGNQVQIKKSDFAKAIAEVLPLMASNQLTGNSIPDANRVTKLAGISYGSFTTTSQNTPIGSGMLIHIQRLQGDLLTNSQYISQYVISTSIQYRRRGKGDGEKIVWADWEEI